MQVDTTKYRAAINQLLQAVQMKEWSMVDSAANALNFLHLDTERAIAVPAEEAAEPEDEHATRRRR